MADQETQIQWTNLRKRHGQQAHETNRLILERANFEVAMRKRGYNVRFRAPGVKGDGDAPIDIYHISRIDDRDGSTIRETEVVKTCGDCFAGLEELQDGAVSLFVYRNRYTTGNKKWLSLADAMAAFGVLGLGFYIIHWIHGGETFGGIGDALIWATEGIWS